MGNNEKTNSANNPKWNAVELLKIFWEKKKLFFKVIGIALVVGLVVAFSIPKSYEVTVTVSPEYSTGGGLENKIGALASMAGFNLGLQSEGDAISPQVYPEITSSVPFLHDLLQIQVRSMDGTINTTLYDYLGNHQKMAWWGHITLFPKKVMKWIFYKPMVLAEDGNLPAPTRKIFYSETETAQISKLQKMISVSLDDVLGIINLTVNMQDPLISEIVADSLLVSLQNYVTKYRTNKALQDLDYMQQLHDESKGKYVQAQQNYARFSDTNIGLVKKRYMAEEERLQQEMALAYNVYSQIAQQLELSKAKVQERTPVFSVIQPPIVPIAAASPRKILILFLYVFLAVVGTAMWIIIKDTLRDIIPQRERRGDSDFDTQKKS